MYDNTPDSHVEWTINGVIGGNETVGTISRSGLYTAPAEVPASGNVTVIANDLGNQNQLAVATISFKDTILINPTSSTLLAGAMQQFSATINGASSTAVIWSVGGIVSGNNTVGTISAGGLYTAPAPAPSSPVIVSAADANDSATIASAFVTVVNPQLAVSPAAISLAGGATKQFSATINGTPSSAVIWSVGGIVGGNATVGTISADGLYTAPNSTSVFTVVVTVGDPEDAFVGADSTVTVLDPAVSVAHDKWLAGLARAAASFGCTSVSVQQQQDETLADALGRFVSAGPENSCLGLWPISTDPTFSRYSFAWGGTVNGKDIFYISDVGQVRIWNGGPGH